jgi:hypothetical protein
VKIGLEIIGYHCLEIIGDPLMLTLTNSQKKPLELLPFLNPKEFMYKGVSAKLCARLQVSHLPA